MSEPEKPKAEDVVEDLIRDKFSLAEDHEEKKEENENETETEDGYKSCEEGSDEEADQKKKGPSDDYVDEEKLKLEEEALTEEQLEDRLKEAKTLKERGNEEYAKEEFKESILSYTKALLVCPLKEKELRAVLYSNRSASKVKLELKEAAIEDCSLALEHNPGYMKPLVRRAKLYDEMDKLDEALGDYKKIVELDPSNRDANIALQRLPSQINERNEKLKTEMMGKLKELGNMVLRPFGLSTENFQLQQDPNSGSYSVNFTK
jgi:tetratricopeptide (TPR) repeat protein